VFVQPKKIVQRTQHVTRKLYVRLKLSDEYILKHMDKDGTKNTLMRLNEERELGSFY
jgi:hypothetical protein